MTRATKKGLEYLAVGIRGVRMKSCTKARMKNFYVQFHRTICHILWLINLVYLSAKYLAYETQVDLGFYTPVTLIQPNLSLCFDLNTILGGHEVLMFNNHTPQYLGMRSQEIFDRVPSVNETMKRCAFRDPVSDQIIEVDNSAECHRIFTIKRYRMHSFMCYLFRMNNRHNFSFNALAFSLNTPKFLYNVAVKGLLTKGHTVAPLLHLDALADVDRVYMKELFPSKRDNELYHLEYDLYEVERLPHPYATRCASEPQFRCLYNCYNQGYAPSKLTLGNSVVQETAVVSSFRVVDYRKNEKVNELRNKVNIRCAKSCTSEACSQQLVVTNFFGPFKSKSHKLSFNVGSYRGPINLMKYSPKLSLADYLTQSLSLSGIWIGFSIVALIYRRKKFDIVNTYNTWVALTVKFKFLKCASRTRTKKVSKVFSIKNREKKVSDRLSKGYRFTATAFKMITLLIFTAQAMNLAFIYSKYETILTYQRTINPEFEYRLPSTAVCLNMDDLFSSREQNVTEENHEDVLTKKNPWINSTLDQIFNRTIGEDILMKCRVKSYGWKEYFMGRFELKTRDECLREEFTFHKYYSRWQMCYLFKPKKLPENLPRKFRQNDLILGAVNPSRLYSLILNPKINHGKIDLIVYFDKANASYMSSEFRAVSPRLAPKRVVILTYHTIGYEFLPAPYDTRCDRLVHQHVCLNRCRKSRLEQFDRLPYTNLFKKKLKKRLLSFQDLKNSSVNDFYWRAEKECDEKCRTSICSGNYTLTYSRHAIDRTNFALEIVVSPEAVPRTISQSVPCFELYDFLYQVFCLLAFWLGFSFVGLNFIHKTRESRFNEAAKILYSESKTLLLSLPFRVKTNNSYTNVLKRNLLAKRVVCYSVCVFGMCLHLLLPISDYLTYPSKLMTTISNEEPRPYKLIVCSEAQDLFEKKVLFGQKRQRSDKYIFDRNLDEIMSEAKKLNHSMSACGYWGLSSEQKATNKMKKVTDRVFFESNNSTACNQSFQTEVFLRQGNVCFQYKLRRKTIWNRSQMLGSFNEAKTVLSVSVDSSAITERFTVIAHFDVPPNGPLHTSVWAPTVHGKPIDRRFVVSYSTFAVSVLPHPYSYKDFVPAQLTYCVIKCANGRLERFNLTRFIVGEKMPSNKLLSNSHRDNILVGNVAREIDKECDRRCFFHNPFRGSTFYYMVTMVSEPLPIKEVQKGSTRFDLRRTDDPVISMNFLVSIPIYDLIINIGSVISIWFGLSVINIPDLASEDDMEKLYISTVDNLETTNYILRRIPINRRIIRSR